MQPSERFDVVVVGGGQAGLAAGRHVPAHERGVVASQPGLYFVGLPFQFGSSSALIDGVDRDADFVSARIASARTQTKLVEV
jgi:putative flavoprotein involved in K+ transport